MKSIDSSIVLFNLIEKGASIFEAIQKKLAKHCQNLKSFKDGGVFIPFFVCSDYDLIRRHGFSIPREFVIETGLTLNPAFEDAPEKEPKYLCEIVGDSLFSRIQLLNDIDRGRVTFSDIKDWCVGAFRKLVFVDENVHGTNGTFDVNKLKKGGESAAELCKYWFGNIDTMVAPDDPRRQLESRFCGGGLPGDAMLPFLPVLREVFEKEFRLVQGFIGHGPDKISEIKNFFDPGPDYTGDILPIPKGAALKFVSPRDKIRILVVDDDAEKEVEGLKAAYEGSLDDMFYFQPFEIKRDGHSSDENFISDVVRMIKGKACPFDTDGKFNRAKALECYDGILLDLSLGEEVGSDLMGYQLIKYFQQFMPAVPLIIYSEHEDMGHIARAFREGARWFLKKSEAKDKLARHFISLKARREWKKEWKVLLSQFEINVDEGNRKFKEKFLRKGPWQYLTLKCLETLPGHYIGIKALGGGISSAVTFMAQKGVTKTDERGKDNQSPVIIKIDSMFNTRMEYERYFRFIRPYIANEAGRVENREIILNADNSAIVYTFAGRRDALHELSTLDDLLRRDLLFRATSDYEKYRRVFDSLFNEILQRLHRVTPVAEFRDTAELPCKLSGYSDYPNHMFGELVRRNDLDNEWNDSWFFSSYTYRMPIERSVSKFKIDESEAIENGVQPEPFEVYGVYKTAPSMIVDPQYPYRWEIECQHYDNGRRDYEKVVLRGDKASFYARFRKYVRPGTVLPIVEGRSPEQELMSWEMESIERSAPFLSIRISKNKFDGVKFNAFVMKSLVKPSVSLVCLNREIIRINREITRIADSTPLIAVRNALQWLCDDQPERFLCPVGIVHGDLNFKNVMIDSRVHSSKETRVEAEKTLSDVWLIDFAKTRRDVIAHDFNVAFTATLPLLFQSDLVGKHNEYKKGDDIFNQSEEQVKYLADLNAILEPFLRHVLFDKSDTVADLFEGDRRLVVVYRILRRIHNAAIDAGLSEDMYLLTTALSCFYSFKIYVKQRMPEAAVALVLAGLLCSEKLLSAEELKKWEKVETQKKKGMAP